MPIDHAIRDDRCGPVGRQEATDYKADLIVIGTHGRRGAGRFFLDSDAHQVLRLAPVPVLLVRDTGKAG